MPERRRRAALGRQGLRQYEKAECCVAQCQRGGREGWGTERVEAQEAAEGGTGHEPEAEGGPDQAQPPGAPPERGAVGYVGLCRRQGPARAAGQHDGREQQRERLCQPEQEVCERRAEQAEDEDRASSGAVREAAQKRPADELHRGVEGAEQADQRRPRGVLPRVEGEEGYHEPVSDHIHEDRDEEERQRRRAPREAHQGYRASWCSIRRRVSSRMVSLTSPSPVWTGRPNATLVVTFRNRGVSICSVAASHSRSRDRRRTKIRGLCRAVGESTPLTTAGTTARSGTSRAKRSRLPDQRPSASVAPGSTAGSGSISPPGKISTAPPPRRCRTALRMTPNRPGEASATEIRYREVFGSALRNGFSAATTRRSRLGTVAKRARESANPGWLAASSKGPSGGTFSRPSTSTRRAIRSSAQAPPAASPDSPTISS